MAGITLAQAQAQLDQWLACLTAISTGQRYTIADRELQRANLGEVQAAVEFWDAKVKQLDTSTAVGRSRRIRNLSPGW